MHAWGICGMCGSVAVVGRCGWGRQGSVWQWWGRGSGGVRQVSMNANAQ